MIEMKKEMLIACMQSLIEEAEAAVNHLSDVFEAQKHVCAASEQIGDDTQPYEASPVTIIHCRDCNHLAKLSSEIHGETKVCQIWWSMIRDPTSTFCSFGKIN